MASNEKKPSKFMNKLSRVTDHIMARKVFAIVGLYMLIQTAWSIYRIATDQLWFAAGIEYTNLAAQVVVLFLIFLNRRQFKPRYVIDFDDYGSQKMSVEEKRKALVTACVSRDISFRLVPDGIGFISKADLAEAKLAA